MRSRSNDSFPYSAFLMFSTISGNLLLARSKPRHHNWIGFWHSFGTAQVHLELKPWWVNPWLRGAVDNAVNLARWKSSLRQLPVVGRVAYPMRAKVTTHVLLGCKRLSCPAREFAAVGTTRGKQTRRIKIPKGSRAEIQISYHNAERADGKNARGYTNLVIAGEASVSIIIEKEIEKRN